MVVRPELPKKLEPGEYVHLEVPKFADFVTAEWLGAVDSLGRKYKMNRKALRRLKQEIVQTLAKDGGTDA